MKQILLATKNKGKKKEFQALFSKYGIDIKTLLDFEEGIADIEETGTTFEENARLKAETISERFNQPVIADDSGLEVEVLAGAPGVYSARYAGQPTNDADNNKKLLDALKGEQNRKARFTCTLAFAIPGQSTIYAEGYCPGKIVEQPRGDHGFGYDPLFMPDDFEVTMAELELSVKNKISHRAKALENLEKILQDKEILGGI